MELREFLSEAVSKGGRKQGYGLELHKCRTIDELVEKLSCNTHFDPSAKTKTTRTSETIRHLLGKYPDETSSAIEDLRDGLGRLVTHYSVYVVRPEERKAYVLNINDVGTDRKINWTNHDTVDLEEYSINSSGKILLDRFIDKTSDVVDKLGEI